MPDSTLERPSPWPTTLWSLFVFIVRERFRRGYDYDSVAKSAALVTVAAFNYFCSAHGMTGFQASWAGMEFLRRIRSAKGPLLLIDGEHMLYPQYDLHGRLDDALTEWKPWAAEQAQELLSDPDRGVPAVRKHWEMLASAKRTGDADMVAR